MKRLFTLTTALILGCGLGLAQADSTWNIQECIDHAIDYNLQVKRQELQLESADKQHLQSKLEMLPSLNGNIDHQLGSGRVLDRGTYEWKNANVSQGDLGLQSDLTLFNGLQTYNSIKMNKAMTRMSYEELRAMEDEVTLDVTKAYLSLLQNKELSGVAEKKMELTQQQVKRMERLVEVGKEPKASLLEVNAQHSAGKLNYTRSLNNLEIARLNLMHLVNVSDPDFDITVPLLPDPSGIEIPVFDTVFTYAVQNMPQIKSKEIGIEAQERNLAMMKGQRSPRLYARGLLYSNYSDGLSNPRDDTDPVTPAMDYPLNQQITDNQYKEVSMGLQLPIFNKWRVQTTINQAKIDLQDAQYQYDLEVLLLQQGLQEIHTEALAARDHYVSASETRASADALYHFAEERFRVGTGTALELQEARNQLYESASEMISAKYVLIFYTQILNFYTGGDISL